MRAILFLVLMAVALASCGTSAASPIIDGARETTTAAAARASRSAAPSTATPQACGTPHTPGDTVQTITSDGVGRSYRLHIPPGYDGQTLLPLVLNFHGYDRSAEDQERYSGLVPVADEHGFILVSPEGLDSPQWWQVVDVEPGSTLIDVDFTRDLVGQLTTDLCVDPGAVFATGMSNGAEMASQVGCLLPDLFAAVAPVAGVVYQDCPGRPMPVVAFHGTDDYNVPFETAEPAMADWAQHNGCTGAEAISESVSEHVTRESYAGCGGNDVVLYVIAGAAHTWPGAEDNAFHGGAGATTHEINASELIWQFFAAHRR